MAAPTEPRNPFYFALLIVGMIFIVTVLAYAVIPVLEDKARDAGTEPPPSWFRHSLKHDGWILVLVEVGVLVLLGLLCMGLDRYRRWQAESRESEASKVKSSPPSSER